MASSKSYDLYLGLWLFVSLFSLVFAHTLPQADEPDPEKKMALDGRINMQDLMRAVCYLKNRSYKRKGASIFPPPETELNQHDYEDKDGDDHGTNDNVKPSKVEWKPFTVAAYPWLKKDGAKTKTVPGNGNRRLLENLSEKEIKLPN